MKTLLNPIENLMMAQEALDYYVELGGTLRELGSKIEHHIGVLNTRMIHEPEPRVVVETILPELLKWYKALDELNTFRTLEGQQEPGFINKDWLVMQWGLYLDYHSGFYEEKKLDNAVPFLMSMFEKYGNIEGNDLEDFTEYIFGEDMEPVLKAFFEVRDGGVVDTLKEGFLERAAEIRQLGRDIREAADEENYEELVELGKRLLHVAQFNDAVLQDWSGENEE